MRANHSSISPMSRASGAHCTSRMLGGIDMAYEGALSWRHLEELLAFLRSVNSAVLEHQGRLARSWYERFHREETLRLALSQSCQIDAPSLRADYRADVLVQALRNSREVTLRGVFYRMTWRYYRRWQARLGRLS